MIDGCDTTIKQSDYGYGNHPFSTGHCAHTHLYWRPRGRHRLGYIWHGGGIHTCFRFLTSTRETTHRRDAHHRIGDNGSSSTASGRRT